jgi:hypothetical protein
MSRSLRNSLLFLACLGASFGVTVLLLQPRGMPGREPPPAPEAVMPPAVAGPRAAASPARLITGTIQPEPPLEVPAELTSFQEAVLDQPTEVPGLVSDLIGAIRGAYARAGACYRAPERSVLEFRIRVRANASDAETLGATFSKVKEGAPVDAGTLDCLTRALSEPLRLRRPAHRPFPAGRGRTPRAPGAGAAPGAGPANPAAGRDV